MVLFSVTNTVTVVKGSEKELHHIRNRCTVIYDYFIKPRYRKTPQHKTRELCYFVDNTFPTGWLSVITVFCRRQHIAYEVEDTREKPSRISLSLLAMEAEPWDHQVEALRSIEEENRGFIHVPTRGGKTLIMGLSIASFAVPSLVIVPNRMLLHQEYDVFCTMFGADHVGRIGDGYEEYNHDIIVATVQTLHSRIDHPEMQVSVFNRIGYVLFDECHHIKQGGYEPRNTYFTVADRFVNAYYRVGFTATPGATGKLQRVLLEAVTGPMLYSISIEKLTEQQILTKAKAQMVVVERPKTPTLREIMASRYNITDSRGDLEETCRQMGIPIPHIPDFRQQLNDKVINSPGFRRLIKTIAEQQAAQGKRVLVVVSRVEKGVEVFTDGGECSIADAAGLSGKTKDREEILQRFKDGQIAILVSTVVKEGVDIPIADVVIMAAADVMDPIPVLQRVGRVLTGHKGKEQALIIDFFIKDKGTLARHSKKRMELYIDQGFEVEVVGAEMYKSEGDNGEDTVSS